MHWHSRSINTINHFFTSPGCLFTVLAMSLIDHIHNCLINMILIHIFSFQIYVLEDSVRNRSPVFLRVHWWKRKTEASQKFAVSQKTKHGSTNSSGGNGVSHSQQISLTVVIHLKREANNSNKCRQDDWINKKVKRSYFVCFNTIT